MSMCGHTEVGQWNGKGLENLDAGKDMDRNGMLGSGGFGALWAGLYCIVAVQVRGESIRLPPGGPR